MRRKRDREADLRAAVSQSANVESALAMLAEIDAGPIEAIKAIQQRFGLGLAEAKRFVEKHGTWPSAYAFPYRVVLQFPDGRTVIDDPSFLPLPVDDDPAFTLVFGEIEPQEWSVERIEDERPYCFSEHDLEADPNLRMGTIYLIPAPTRRASEDETGANSRSS